MLMIYINNVCIGPDHYSVVLLFYISNRLLRLYDMPMNDNDE